MMAYDFNQEHPSEKIVRTQPYARLQWKGTDACMDLECECGMHGHLDEDFLYHVKCSGCGRVYEVDPYVVLRPIDVQPDHVHLFGDIPSQQ